MLFSAVFYTVEGTGDTRGLSEVDNGCFTYRFSEKTSFVADFIRAAELPRFNFVGTMCLKQPECYN